MFKELRERAIAKKEELEKDPNASELDKNLSKHIVEFLSTRDGFDHVSASTVFTMFGFLGYEVDIKKYQEMYDKLIEEINKTYKYVDPNSFIQR